MQTDLRQVGRETFGPVSVMAVLSFSLFGYSLLGVSVALLAAVTAAVVLLVVVNVTIGGQSLDCFLVNSSACYCAIGLWRLIIVGAPEIENSYSLLVGDADSLQYHMVGSYIANTVTLFAQFNFFDLNYLQGWQSENGVIIANPGFYWLTGVLYSIVGESSGPFLLAFVNPLLLGISVTLLFAVLTQPLAVNDSVRNKTYLWMLSFAFYCNRPIYDLVLSCRKDVVVTLLVSLSVYLVSRTRIKGVLLMLPVLTFIRLAYVLILPGLWLCQELARRKLSRRAPGLALVLLTMFFCSLLARVVVNFLPSEYVLIDARTALLFQGQSDGTAVLLTNWWLNWAYALFAPFPPIANFDNAESTFLAYSTFVVNCGLLYYFVRITGRDSRTLRSVAFMFFVTLLLYVSFSLIVTSAVLLERIGTIEPRYKVGVWVFQFAVVSWDVLVNSGARVPVAGHDQRGVSRYQFSGLMRP